MERDSKMRAFVNTEVSKPELIASLEAHKAADRIVHGHYWQDGKGCAVGCSIHDFKPRAVDDHSSYEPLFGIPQVLARLEDTLFERMQNGTAIEWPLRFANAVPIGADLSMVWPRFALWLLAEELPRHTKNEKSLAAINGVWELYAEWVSTGTKPDTERWARARRAAAYAYAYADADAYAYAYAAAAAAADAADAAYAAAAAADAAAAAAAAAADAAAARNECVMRQADKLIELIQAAGPGVS